MAEDIKIPGEPKPTGNDLIRTLTIAASALTAASIAVNLILQVAHFAKKRPVEPDQRDKVQGFQLAVLTTKHLPGLIKQVRILLDQVRSA